MATITGRSRADRLTGAIAPDDILGFDGHGLLSGLAGYDSLWAGDGDDRLVDLVFGADGVIHGA